MAVRHNPSLELSSKNIMGVVVPKIKSEAIQLDAVDRGYGMLSRSALIDDASVSFDALTQKVIKAAEVETALKKLLIEIEKTKRRVNALEFEVIPKMKDLEKFILLRLQEMERENIFRLKRIKA